MINMNAIRSVVARDSKAYIECRTEYEASEVCRALHSLGYGWRGGENLLKCTHFGVYSGGIKYFLHRGRIVTYGPISYIDNTFEEVSAFLQDEDDYTDYEIAGLMSWIQSVSEA